MLEITQDSIFTIEIIEQKPQIIEIITPNLIKIDVLEKNSSYNLMLVEGTNYVAEIIEGLNYLLNVEPANVHTIEISEKVSFQKIETINTITNNITNDIDNLSVEIACDSSVFIGAAVYIKIDSGTAKVYSAKADDLATSNVFGIVESKLSETLCKVRFGGKTADIFTNLDPAKEYYLSATDAGQIVVEDNIPTAVGSILVKIGQPFSENSLLYLRGGKTIVLPVSQSQDVMSFGFSGDIAIDTGLRTNTQDIIDHGLRFI